MKSRDIVDLIIKKIPSTHILNDHVHYFRKHSISRDVHPFIKMLADALEYLDRLIPGYAVRIVDWLATLTNEHEYEQNFAVFGEILVTYNAAKIAGEINGKRYIISEPASQKGSKNPEFRSILDNIHYAGEVKTPSLAKYITKRQSAIQITAHLPNKDLFNDEQIVNPNVLRILDNLKSTHAKYEEYIKKEEYEEDYRFLFIVWDDFINEPISALLSPFSGLFTENTFYPESNFHLIDGVFIIRHLHQFRRILRNEELMYDLEHVFEWTSPKLPAAFIQNPHGRMVPQVFIDKFNAVNPKSMIFAEYRATDWVDWRTGIALSGLNSIPTKYHEKIVDVIRKSTNVHLDRVLPESANFGVINLNNFIENRTDSMGNINYEEVMKDFSKAVDLAMKAQYYWEQKEKEIQEKQAEIRYEIQLKTLKQHLGIIDTLNFDKQENHSLQINREKVGRNEKCPCGSGLKYKKCCLLNQ